MGILKDHRDPLARTGGMVAIRGAASDQAGQIGRAARHPRAERADESQVRAQVS